ncbi:hypothetical protein L227DRAFT_594892 [Lentinus tigrinus ALCF2SS1-6]|uniref:Uncharacterized protein n=1 Tax=Lentinus tigrinus ALCF2SS1-6 TaxID=1328759 RepID=A0A5C2S197_9APHY|nr:hypothetical protein L227DRAFT_594892 [Lentinus tigrinus ALCF2SS1-6]
MPTWGVGDNHDSDEVRTLKDQIRTKDAQQGTLQSELMKREGELKEVKASLNEALAKLRQDADRVLQLEAALKQRNEDLSNERLTRANAEVALTTAERRLKESEQETLELQSTLDTLSARADSTTAGHSKLEQDNANLHTRIRALERELQNKAQAEEAALRQSQSSSSARYCRQPSEVFSRVPILEKELVELRAASSRQASELQRTVEQLSSTRSKLLQVQNEKIASERHLQKQLADTQAALDDRTEDLRVLRDARGGEDAVDRESNLLERLEEEEKRVAALENELARSAGSRKRDLAMLQDELDRTTQLLEDAKSQAATTEERLSVFAKEREAAFCDRRRLEQEQEYMSQHLQEAEAKISALEYQLAQTCPNPQTTDDNTAAMIEKLLNTIHRLRGERDDYKRRLDFVTAEDRFTIESLERRLAAATAVSVPVTPAVTETGTVTILQGYIQAFHENTQRSTRAALALAIVAQHAGAHRDIETARVEALLREISSTREHLQQAECTLQERQHTLASLEQKLASTSGAFGDTESQVVSLRETIQCLEEELARERNSHAQTGAALSETEAQLHMLTEELTNAEAARDALALEKTHLETDLEAARQDLAEAETSHSEQLAGLSAAAQSGHGAQAQALRAHIHDLELRVQRRTEQIGMHQHDIRRLETNMKLQEERVAELTQELEVVQNEKVAMLEDCRTTREERDNAMRRLDELEEAMETVEESREKEIETLVHVTFAAVAARRDAVIRSRYATTVTHNERASLEERVRSVEDEKAALSAQVISLTAERDQLAKAGQHDLSSTRAQLDEATAKLLDVEEAKAAVESELASARSQLEEKDRELSSLQNQLATARASYVDRQSLEATMFAQEKADLETCLQDSQSSLADWEKLHSEAVEKLKGVEEELRRAEDELASQLASSAARSESEERLRDELAQVRQQHAEEASALEDRLKSVNDELEAMTRLRGEADASRQAVEDELARMKQQLETRLVEAGEALDTASRLEAELAQLKASHAEEMRNLRRELEAITTELRDVSHRKEELEAMHEKALHESQGHATQAEEIQQKAVALEGQLAELRASHAQELQNLQKRLEEADQELRETKASADAQQRDVADELTRAIEELKNRLTALTREADECRAELADEKASHARTRESATAELHEVVAMRDEAEAALVEAENELPGLRAQLEHAEASLRQMEQEKLDLQYQTTNMEAEIQRAKSLERFLESQVADGKRHASSLEVELADLRTKCTTLDKLAQTTEANLAMQTIQHEQLVASLRRELNALRAQPSLEDEIVELKEKNAEYEELLRAKCLEIEENDDKFIDMLKEKKKLNSKIDSLTRKVQNLQAKLAAATEAAAKSAQQPPVVASSPPAPAPPPKPQAVFSPSVLAPAPIITSASTSRTMSRQRVVTAPAFSLEDAAPIQPPPMPAFRPKTPESSRMRMMSGPSSISRPKTPESQSRLPSLPVFKARTPERHRVPTTILSESSSSSSSLIGVKRRAPDDFDDCGSLPPQTFTADSAPLGQADSATPAQPTTPRLRKALQTMRTGFTPVRHTTRAGSASPRRATTGTTTMAAPLPHTIADVTNSPRSSARHEPAKAAAKKGWLGKIRTGPSQPRTFPPRQPVFDPPNMR